MERRNFIRGFFGIIGAGIAAPQLLKGMNIPEEKNIAIGIDSANKTITIEPHDLGHGENNKLFREIDFTEELFKYLEEHKDEVEFKWVRERDGIFKDRFGTRTLQCRLRKLNVHWCPEISQDFQARYGRLTGIDLETTIKENIVKEIVNELEGENRNTIERFNAVSLSSYSNPEDKIVPVFHIHQILKTPTMYDPYTYAPRTGLLISYRKVIFDYLTIK